MSETLEMIAFGPFRLDTHARQLLCARAPVPLSSRGFDILALLVENRGRVVTKDEIMTHVWRGMIVEENNLAVQVSALRRALAQAAGTEAGRGVRDAPVILTVPGQGYRFVARLARDEADASLDTPAQDEAPMPAAPQPDAPLPETSLAVPAIAAARPGWTASRRGAAVTATLALCLLAIAGFVLRHTAPVPREAALSPPRLSIAVLPFRDLSDDRCCDYLADAISDDLTTDLSLIPGSVVIARESADMYRNHPAPAGTIGRALNVRYLLEGSLRSMDGVFSINAQLIEAATGGHLWAERFTVPRAHLGEAQNAIVQRLASALGVKLVAIEGDRSWRDHAEDPDALDLFLRARSVLDRSDSLEGMNEAQALLERARAKQPDDVKVLSELGWLLPRKIHNYVTPHREADLAEARDLTSHAVRLAPSDPSVLSSHAALQMYDGNCADAQRTFQAALEARPNEINALTGLAVCEFSRGDFASAAKQLDALLRVDPEGPRQKTRYYQLGFSNLMLGDLPAAIFWLRKSLTGDATPLPGDTDAGTEWKHLALIAATRLSGGHETSAALFTTYQKAWPNRSTWALESRSPRAFSALPAFHRFLDALQDIGMPRYLNEQLAPSVPGCGSGAYSGTPKTVNGVQTIRSQDLLSIAGKSDTVVTDFGTGAAVPVNATLAEYDPLSVSEMKKFLAGQDVAVKKIVVMGSSAVDSVGCQAAAAAFQAAETIGGQYQILWYRGGEEGWAHDGMRFRDLR